MKSYGKVVAIIIAGWVVIAVGASALHVFQNTSNRVGIATALAAVTPIGAFALWYTGSAGFRQFVLSLNPRTLTLVQTWRFAGLLFVILQSYGVLPAIFALPAGYGDMTIGLTAPLIAWKLARPSHRHSFVLWQVLGIADLVMAVTLGTTARLLSPNGLSMAAMTVLPLSLVPTLVVPLLFILHLICIAQARKWAMGSGESGGIERHFLPGREGCEPRRVA